jgi:hypothetical protein
MFGKKHSNEAKKKMSDAWSYEKKITPDRNRKISEALKKRYAEGTAKCGFKKGNTLGGNPWNKASRDKASLSHKGERSYNWMNGKSFEPYGLEFNKDLKKVIRTRDRFTCFICKKVGFCVHHIDYNKKNNNPSNLITLCRKCHCATNYNRENWIKLFI